MFYFSTTELNDGGNFIMLCGAPGAGKSTKAHEIVDNNESDSSWVIVSTDEIRKNLFDLMGHRATNKVVFEKVHETIRKALLNGYNVIYDATNCNYQSRRNIMNTVKKVITGRSLCLIFKTSFRDCLDNVAVRNENGGGLTGYYVSEDVVENMYTKLKTNPPSMREGYDIIAYV